MSLEQYNELRHVGINLSEVVPKKYITKDTLISTVRTLGIGQGRQIILESDEEMNFLMDFYLHEFLVNGQTILERYRSDCDDLKPMEIFYLDVAKASYTSLFKVLDVNPQESRLTVIDMLDPDAQPLSVINVNLSKTGQPGFVLFTRLLPSEQFNSFSGMFAVFYGGNDRALLKRYRVLKKRVKSDRESVQRFVACFKMNRTLGLPTQTK
jgi:hypothetical protein